jgi:hypothetical protein
LRDKVAAPDAKFLTCLKAGVSFGKLMKIMISLYILCCAVIAVGQEGASRFVPNKHPAGNNTCAAAPHEHRWSDLRIIPVEVQKMDSCGFSYVDLELNTVGPDNHAQFAPHFTLTRVEDNGMSQDILMDKLAMKAVKKGVRGIAIICQHCQAALTLRPFTKDMQSVAHP